MKTSMLCLLAEVLWTEQSLVHNGLNYFLFNCPVELVVGIRNIIFSHSVLKRNWYFYYLLLET